jgi:hypothetical protein
MQRRSNVATGVVFILVMVLHALTVSTARGQVIQGTIPIAQARQQPPHTRVTVTGSVTVLPGTFESFSFDQGFAIQQNDPGTPPGGIYVSVATAPNLILSQKVRVTGRLADSFGLLILVPQNMVHNPLPCSFV